jgi:hypothetical protein
MLDFRPRAERANISSPRGLMGSIALSFSGTRDSPGEWAAPLARAGEPRVPEKESAIDPINPRGELILARSALGRKSSIASSIFVRLGSRLAGSIGRSVLHGLVFFEYFISQISILHIFETSQ